MLELFKTRLRAAIWGESGFHTTKEHNRQPLQTFTRSKKTYSKWTFWEKFRVAGFEPGTPGSPVQHSNHQATTAAAKPMENLWYLCCDLLMYTVASPDPDPNPREGGQLRNPKSAILC